MTPLNMSTFSVLCSVLPVIPEDTIGYSVAQKIEKGVNKRYAFSSEFANGIERSGLLRRVGKGWKFVWYGFRTDRDGKYHFKLARIIECGGLSIIQVRL